MGPKCLLGPLGALWAHGAHGPKCLLGPFGALWAHGPKCLFGALWAHGPKCLLGSLGALWAHGAKCLLGPFKALWAHGALDPLPGPHGLLHKIGPYSTWVPTQIIPQTNPNSAALDSMFLRLCLCLSVSLRFSQKMLRKHCVYYTFRGEC